MSAVSTSPDTALRTRPPDPATGSLRQREAELARRELELADYKRDLQQVQGRYLDEIGGYYAELGQLEAELVEAEVRAGIRPPPMPVDEAPGPGGDEGAGTVSCANPAAPSAELKRIFRDLAKTIHPDLALDEPARCRRHSLMAEANRAYAERDEDRLRLILRAWERSPEAVPADDPASGRLRLERRLTELDERLIAVEAEFADLRASAIGRLKRRIDEARSQGWDLFAEMILQVRSEIARTTRRLRRLRTDT